MEQWRGRVLRQRRKRPVRRERGIALVIMGLTLVFLLVMCAFVVDLGAAYVEKRNDQNAADAGALADCIGGAAAEEGGGAYAGWFCGGAVGKPVS